MLLRLSLLPLLAFRSLSSEHATHHAFFRDLFDFLQTADDPTLTPAEGAAATEGATAADGAVPAPSTSSTENAGQTAPSEPAAPVASTAPPAAASSAALACAAAREERLATANAIIRLAHTHAEELRREINELGGRPAPARVDSVVRQWAARLGRRRLPAAEQLQPWGAAAAPPPAGASIDAALEAFRMVPTDAGVVVSWWELPDPDPPAVEALGRWARRAALARYAMAKRRKAIASGLARRSAVFRVLMEGSLRKAGYDAGCAERGLVGIALASLALCVLAVLPAIVLVLLLLPLGTLFPIVQLGLSLVAAAQAHTQAAMLNATTVISTTGGAGGVVSGTMGALGAAGAAGAGGGAGAAAAFDAVLVLPWTLSGVLVVLLLPLLLLLPRVHRFQSLRADIAPTAGLPPAFFSSLVVSEMRKRYVANRTPAAQGAALWDQECCVCIRPLTPRGAAVLVPCGHCFHHECIQTWLRAGRHTCPLCRANATLDDVALHPLAVDVVEEE